MREAFAIINYGERRFSYRYNILKKTRYSYIDEAKYKLTLLHISVENIYIGIEIWVGALGHQGTCPPPPLP